MWQDKILSIQKKTNYYLIYLISSTIKFVYFRFVASILLQCNCTEIYCYPNMTIILHQKRRKGQMSSLAIVYELFRTSITLFLWLAFLSNKSMIDK